MSPASRKLPECWGHRGASAAFPENTLASFEAAMRDGADGIESDVHVSLDGVVVMFHDPYSVAQNHERDGFIKERNWYGEDGMEHLRTIKEPKQSIPTFAETVTLLMKPENEHIMFNIDVNPITTPPSPAIILGLWHPTFLPTRRRSCRIAGVVYWGDTSVARTYFWDNVDQRPECMMEAVRWGVDAILTDVTKTWLDLRGALQVDYDKIAAQHRDGSCGRTTSIIRRCSMCGVDLDRRFWRALRGRFRGCSEVVVVVG
ncbi:PLC-like phosphodiesterase [Irpex lacteus]|nr:PLC-like phosphodiesterase [Irpex lacteus]